MNYNLSEDIIDCNVTGIVDYTMEVKCVCDNCKHWDLCSTGYACNLFLQQFTQRELHQRRRPSKVLYRKIYAYTQAENYIDTLLDMGEKDINVSHIVSKWAVSRRFVYDYLKENGWERRKDDED